MPNDNESFMLTLWRTFSRGRRGRYTWREFIDTFVAQPEVVRDKTQVAGFSIASFEGNRRTLSRVEGVHALVLDFDHGDTTLVQAQRLIPGTQSIAYTTFSHTPEHPKLRAIFPLSRPVLAGEYARIWAWAEQGITRAGHVLDEAARIEGCTPLQVLWKVYVPLARPVYLAYALVSVSYHWNNFLWPLIITNSVGSRPLTVGLQVFSATDQGIDWSIITAATLLTTAPLLIAFLLFQRQFVQSFMRAGIR
jgi:hypothetical protein